MRSLHWYAAAALIAGGLLWAATVLLSLLGAGGTLSRSAMIAGIAAFSTAFALLGWLLAWRLVDPILRAAAAAAAVMVGSAVLLVVEAIIREALSFDGTAADVVATLIVAGLATAAGAGYLARSR